MSSCGCSVVSVTSRCLRESLGMPGRDALWMKCIETALTRVQE
jgi:hypothetical protein